MQYRNSDEVPAISLRGLIAALRRQAVWILVTTLLGAGLTLYVVQRQRPVYEARATLRMPEQQYAPTTDVLAALNGPSTIETEMEILRSRSVAEKAVQALGLQLTITEPVGVPRDSLFGVLRFASDARPGTYVVRRDTTAFSVTAPSGETMGSPYGIPLEVGGVTLEPLPLADSSAGAAQITLAVAGLSDAAEELRGGLRVTRPQDYAGIVAVAWQSTDPVLAMQVVNGVAEAYIQKRGETQRETYHAAAEFLRTQVDTIHAQLAQAEQVLEQYRRANGLIDPAAQASDQVRRATDLQVRSEELTQQSSILWSLIARTQQPAESAADWTAFVSSPVLAQNQAIGNILGQLTPLEVERARMLAGRTAAEAQVANLTGIIASLRGQLKTVARAALQGLEDEKRSVQATLDRSDARLAVVPEKQLQFARLSRQVDLNNDLYGMLQKRLKEAEVSEASEVAGVSVVDPAIVPTAPLGGRRFFNLLFGAALSFLCGGLVALARESADTRVRSREELVRLTELPLLASIPRMRLTNGFRREAAGRIEGRLVLRHAPRSPAAEAYRALRTNVAFAGNGNRQPLKSIVVTSAEPMDGKTTTAVNLSVTLAEQGHRVVLIEADQRRPVLHKVLHTERAPGLSDLLVGAAPLERTLHAIALPDFATGTFHFTPAGHAPPNPAELLGSAAMQELLVTLGERFDTVVIDTPPLCVVTDAAVVGARADGVLMVARMGATHGDALQRSVEEMRGLGARVVGTVLTDVSQHEDRYGYRYGYYQYYDEDGAHGNGNGNGNGKRRGRR